MPHKDVCVFLLAIWLKEDVLLVVILFNRIFLPLINTLPLYLQIIEPFLVETIHLFDSPIVLFEEITKGFVDFCLRQTLISFGCLAPNKLKLSFCKGVWHKALYDFGLFHFFGVVFSELFLSEDFLVFDPCGRFQGVDYRYQVFHFLFRAKIWPFT